MGPGTMPLAQTCYVILHLAGERVSLAGMSNITVLIHTLHTARYNGGGSPHSNVEVLLCLFPRAQELEELKEANTKLCEVRTNMDDELHTLTENLFEEAYKMVDTAKEEKGLAVKRLADAAGKIDAMETEMSALKNLLHTPTHPLTVTLTKTPSPHAKHRKPNVKKVFVCVFACSWYVAAISVAVPACQFVYLLCVRRL